MWANLRCQERFGSEIGRTRREAFTRLSVHHAQEEAAFSLRKDKTRAIFGILE